MRAKQPLDTYLADYRHKHDGFHDLLWAFRLVEENFDCRRVLYPGSYLHVTPSLVFPEVCYVDSVKGIAAALASHDLLEYLSGHREYSENPRIWCYEEDYARFDSEPHVSFDLLISLNAGFVSQACRSFLKPGGLLLANNGHYDAARAQVDPGYRLVGALDGGSLLLDSSHPDLSSHFRTAKGEALTLEMVEADAKRPPSRARFMPSREMEAYLFQLAPIK
ncbi:MAG: hypothetical protein F4X66_20925 [Chloroflexi bacterium]|nr:hypothetical protein [Chloroflexota bacterium]MYE41673.1 hypothetical protein [Chloroflexota bacterium]